MSAPTLVVGTGRCGSTLVSHMLREHPHVVSISELFSFVTDLGMRIAYAFPDEMLDGDAFWQLLSAPLPRQTMLLRHGLQMSEVCYPLGRGRFAGGELPPIQQGLLPHLSEDPDALFDALEPAMRSRGLAPIGEHYRALFEWLQRRFGKRTWAERSGGSLRVAHRMLEALPEAKVLHLVRDGRNTAMSMSNHIGFRMALLCGQQLEFLGVDPFESDDRSEEDDLTDELIDLLPENFSREAFEAFELSPALCGHYWSGEIVAGLEALESASDRLLTLRYEDFLERPEWAVRRLGSFVDDELDSQWMNRAVSMVGEGRSAWTSLPARARQELEEACAPGFAALRERDLIWES